MPLLDLSGELESSRETSGRLPADHLEEAWKDPGKNFLRHLP
jgi:hypothetical protein